LIRKTTGKRPQRLGLEMDVIPAALYLQYLKLFTGAEPVDVSRIVRRIRMNKTD
jgi:hypothetical protein